MHLMQGRAIENREHPWVLHMTAYRMRPHMLPFHADAYCAERPTVGERGDGERTPWLGVKGT